MGSGLGVEKVAAKRIGVALSEYRAHRDRGEKWCTGCKRWHDRSWFAVDRSRGDGLSAVCRQARNAAGRERYEPIPRPAAGRRFVAARAGDKRQARRRVNHLVDIGKLPDPDDVRCADCGHSGAGRRHEYHHHKGYAPEHHEDVIALCASCHHRRDTQDG